MKKIINITNLPNVYLYIRGSIIIELKDGARPANGLFKTTMYKEYNKLSSDDTCFIRYFKNGVFNGVLLAFNMK